MFLSFQTFWNFTEARSKLKSSSFFFFFCSLFRLIFSFGVPLRRGNGHKRRRGGGSRSAKPEAGRALMECLRAGEGKAVIRIWMERQERGERRLAEEKGGLWLNYSPHHGRRRRTFSFSARRLILHAAADTWCTAGRGGAAAPPDSRSASLSDRNRCKANKIWFISIIKMCIFLFPRYDLVEKNMCSLLLLSHSHLQTHTSLLLWR